MKTKINQKYIKSPLNYMGGKFKLLDNILPLFPKKIHKFVDLFAGGFNVGINVDADYIICNDQITYLIDLFKFFQQEEYTSIINKINNKIEKFNLSDQNQDGYKKLREDYNKNKNILDFFILTCYSFNHQIRFNSKYEFNTPFGKSRSSFNNNIKYNLERFTYALKEKNIVFTNNDFTELVLDSLDENDFVYCDPPYLITNGSYNDGKRGFKDWTETEEKQLLDLLDKLNQKKVKFALSNVIFHKGSTNSLLAEWSKKYKLNKMNKNYDNCSYHLKNKNQMTMEVLITNYEEKNEEDFLMRDFIAINIKNVAYQPSLISFN